MYEINCLCKRLIDLVQIYTDPSITHRQIKSLIRNRGDVGIKDHSFPFWLYHSMSYIKNILALKIPLFVARYHGYLFGIQTLHVKKFNNSLRIIVRCLALSAHPLVDIKGQFIL